MFLIIWISKLPTGRLLALKGIVTSRQVFKRLEDWDHVNCMECLMVACSVALTRALMCSLLALDVKILYFAYSATIMQLLGVSLNDVNIEIT